MFHRPLFTLTLLICSTLCAFKVFAVDDQQQFESSDADNFVEVQFEVGRAVFLPDPRDIAQGKAKLHCTGLDAYASRIYWRRNGERILSKDVDEEDSNLFRSIHTLLTEDEAYYSCNGVGIYLVAQKNPQSTATASVWRGSDVICIDSVTDEETTRTSMKGSGPEQTQISFYNGYNRNIVPVKERTVSSDMTFKCNNTEAFTFKSESRPQSNVRFEGKKIICTSSDDEARCTLTIFFGDKELATGPSPEITYTYKKINIQKVFCKSECLIGEDFIVLPVQGIEINRALYIGVVFCIILIILIIIILICCVLWHKFGFKEKYGYQINMRMKKNFAVDGNKLSSYRLSGVEADAAKVDIAADDSDDDVKIKDIDVGSLVDDDSFVDPNFAKTNRKIDMRSKDDVSGQPINQRPFLRI